MATLGLVGGESSLYIVVKVSQVSGVVAGKFDSAGKADYQASASVLHATAIPTHGVADFDAAGANEEDAAEAEDAIEDALDAAELADEADEEGSDFDAREDAEDGVDLEDAVGLGEAEVEVRTTEEDGETVFTLA